MLKAILRDRVLIFLLLLALLVKLFSLNAAAVESYYTSGIYPYIGALLRTIFGWIPFSVGDLLYLGAFIFLVLKAWKLVRLLGRRGLRQHLTWPLMAKYLKLVLAIYLVFNIFWGLNYDRQGIARQFGLKVQQYSPADLYELAAVLQKQVNFYAARVDSLHRLPLNQNSVLFDEGIAAYKIAAKRYPFLQYHQPSIKPSLFTWLGAYFGFTGYYNPFTGEAQLKTNVPVFTKPFIVCHEMGHQLGYARENEANFSSWLAGRVSDNMEFRYSVYFDMYTYAMHDLVKYNPECFIELKNSEHPQIKKDIAAYREYLFKTRNAVEPIMSNVYDQYLKMNKQPRGKETYNEVVDWLLAYMKKYGRHAI